MKMKSMVLTTLLLMMTSMVFGKKHGPVSVTVAMGKRDSVTTCGGFSGNNRKHPVTFTGDTVRITDMPARYNRYFKLYGFTVSSYYELVDTLSVGNVHAAILSPAVMGFAEQPDGNSIYSDRLLLIERAGRRWVYDNVICNEKNYSPSFNCELLATKPEFLNDIVPDESPDDFFLTYEYGQGAKAGWNIKITFRRGEPFVSGMMWYDHSNDMRQQRHIFDMSLDFPLRDYRRSMPRMLRDDKLD